MATDARISVGLPAHPKTKKLVKRLGQAAAWNLVCLILWSAANRSDGDLTGMSDEDIELAADWGGDDGAFVRALLEVRFIDGTDGAYVLHDWHEHNPWAAGADMRSAKARWNAAKRHHGATEADRLVPEYAAVRNAGSNAGSTQTAEGQEASSNAPSPSPSPSPSQSKTSSSHPRKRGEPQGLRFEEFWLSWPKHERKQDRAKCWDHWRRNDLDALTDTILADVRTKRGTTKWQDGFIEAPLVYLRGRRWEDGVEPASAVVETLAGDL